MRTQNTKATVSLDVLPASPPATGLNIKLNRVDFDNVSKRQYTVATSFTSVPGLSQMWVEFSSLLTFFPLGTSAFLSPPSPVELITYLSCSISIGNHVNASAFRDIWARMMFLKFSKLHEPQASAI